MVLILGFPQSQPLAVVAGIAKVLVVVLAILAALAAAEKQVTLVELENLVKAMLVVQA
jgi:hypothetical protein